MLASPDSAQLAQQVPGRSIGIAVIVFIGILNLAMLRLDGVLNARPVNES